MNRTNYLILSAIILQVIISFINENIIASPQYQDDTVKAVMVRQSPVFDGKSNDSIWSLAKWQPIDEDRSMGRHMYNHNAFGIFITGGNKKVTFY